MSPLNSPPPPQPSLDKLREEAREWVRRPRRNGSWYAAEDMLRTKRTYGWALLIAAIAQPVLYLLGLVLGIAALIPETIDDAGASVSYLEFVAPGLLMTAALAVAAEEFSSPVLAGFTRRRSFQMLGSSPLSAGQIANGVIIAAAVRMTLVSAVFYVIISLIGAVPEPAAGWIGIFVAVVCGLAVGLPLMAYAARIREDNGRFALAQRVVFVPLVFFSGVFYPLSAMPGWLSWIGWLSPVWHATELGRIASYSDGEDPTTVIIHIAFVVLAGVLGYVVARRAFVRRLAAS